MALFDIPIIAEPDQTFIVSLDGDTFNFRLTFNNLDSLWRLRVTDANDNAVFSGRPLVLGAPLDRGTIIKGFLFMLNNAGDGIEADFDRLVDDDVSLVYGDTVQP